MPRPKKEGGPGYEPTVQFRPVPALAALVRGLAKEHGLALNEAYKDLAALAAVGLDCRFFATLNQMAAATGGANAFVHACLHVHAALEGAARSRGAPIQAEPERSQFVVGIVGDYLAGGRSEAAGEAAPETQPSSRTGERVKRKVLDLGEAKRRKR